MESRVEKGMKSNLIGVFDFGMDIKFTVEMKEKRDTKMGGIKNPSHDLAKIIIYDNIGESVQFRLPKVKLEIFFGF